MAQITTVEKGVFTISNVYKEVFRSPVTRKCLYVFLIFNLRKLMWFCTSEMWYKSLHMFRGG